MSKILVVDGMSILKTIAGPMSRFTNGYSFNFFQSLTSTMKKVGPVARVYVCWEGGHDHRLKIFSDYKKDRPKASNDLVRNQRENFVKPLLVSTGCHQLTASGFEGDDVGAWITRELRKSGLEVVLYSNDQDWLQLVRPGVSVYQKVQWDGQTTERLLVTADNFQKLTGFKDGRTFLRAKAICGDGSDQIPGLYGVGPTVVKSYLAGGEVRDKKNERIEEFIASEAYGRNLQLMNLIDPGPDMEIHHVLGDLDQQKTLQLVTEYGWASVVKKFPAWWELFAGKSS